MRQRNLSDKIKRNKDGSFEFENNPTKKKAKDDAEIKFLDNIYWKPLEIYNEKDLFDEEKNILEEKS